MAVVTGTRDYNTRFLALLSRRAWITRVRVVPEPEACGLCSLFAATYPRRDLPDLPNARCTRRGGCGCWYAALVPASASGASAV